MDRLKLVAAQVSIRAHMYLRVQGAPPHAGLFATQFFLRTVHQTYACALQQVILPRVEAVRSDGP